MPSAAPKPRAPPKETAVGEFVRMSLSGWLPPVSSSAVAGAGKSTNELGVAMGKALMNYSHVPLKMLMSWQLVFPFSSEFNRKIHHKNQWQVVFDGVFSSTFHGADDTKG